MDIVRELKDPALVQQSANQSMKVLEDMVKHGQNVPMSEFVKVLLWEKQCLCELFNNEIKNAKNHGATFEDHTWCGEPYHSFKVPSLGIRPL